MSAPEIRRAAGEADIILAGELIARSFDELPANRYLVPDLARRQPILSRYFGLVAGHAADGAGEVLLLEQDGHTRAVAVWFDHTKEAPPFVDYEERLDEFVPAELRDRFAHLDKMMEENHPEQPHAYLAFAAVRPEDQGRGLGTTLLTATHERLDAEGIDAYLEASNSHSQALYRRLGYADTGVYTLADGSPFLQMWRRPK